MTSWRVDKEGDYLGPCKRPAASGRIPDGALEDHCDINSGKRADRD